MVEIQIILILPMPSKPQPLKYKVKICSCHSLSTGRCQFFPPNGACPILEQTAPHSVSLSAAQKWCSPSVKSLLSSHVCRPISLHSGFKQPLLQTDVYVAWNRATEGNRLCPECFQNTQIVRRTYFILVPVWLGKDLEKPGVSICLSATHQDHTL